MDETSKIIALENELEKLVTRYAHEFDMHWVTVIGILECQAHALKEAAIDDDRPRHTD